MQCGLNVAPGSCGGGPDGFKVLSRRDTPKASSSRSSHQVDMSPRAQEILDILAYV